MPPKRSQSSLSVSAKKSRSSLTSSLKASATPSIPSSTAFSISGSSNRSPLTGEQKGYDSALLTEAEGRQELDVDDEKWDGIWNRTKSAMGKVRPVHAERQNRIQHILRVFDLDPTYGPCIGLTRLERWERAEELGEQPPREVHEILTTKQGTLEYRDCLFKVHGL